MPFPRQPCCWCLGRAETPLSQHGSHHLLMPHLPICKMCRAPPCFASINHRDPSLDIQVKRHKYHSAKSRHHETVETRTRWHRSLTSQHRTELAQNTAQSTLHFYLVQPSGCHTAADITTGRTLNQSIFKVLEKGGNMHTPPKSQARQLSLSMVPSAS